MPAIESSIQNLLSKVYLQNCLGFTPTPGFLTSLFGNRMDYRREITTDRIDRHYHSSCLYPRKAQKSRVVARLFFQQLRTKPAPLYHAPR
jgi:hypothetical protein